MHGVDVRFFRSAAGFRKWLERHHARASEVWIGFYRKDSGRTGISYAEAVDEALCFGWIDGVRRKVDAESYTNRFTPRKPRSNWSAVNIRRVQALTAAGRMAAAGTTAFETRDPRRTQRYSFEQRPQDLPAAYARRVKSVPGAWAFFSSQPPFYRRVATWWVVSAVKEETRQRRLEALIEASADGRRIGLVTGASRKAP
jgi:uncharacterized protein YdeI (YjbR/CyaY-like superfamily)